MLLNIWNCVYDCRHLFQKQRNWQGFLNISATVFIAPQMICTQCKMFRAEPLWNWFLQWWFAGNFSVSFHKCHINSSEAKQNPRSALKFGVQSQTTSDAHGWDSAPHSFAKCEPAPLMNCNLFFCGFYWRMSTELVGKGKCWYVLPVFRTQMAPTCLRLGEGGGSCWAASQQRLMKSKKFRGRSCMAPRALAYESIV